MFASLPLNRKNDPLNHTIPSLVEKHVSLNNSYASVVRGHKAEKFTNDNADTIIDVESGDFITDSKKLACLVKARDFITLPNLGMLCHDEGFENFHIGYVGGLWTMFEFSSSEACKNFLETDVVNHWITEKRKWDRNFIPSDRIVWVDIEGLPLRAWIKVTFRKIVAKWGNIVHLDDNIGEDIYKSRVCILTSFFSIILEVVKVSVDGITFPITRLESNIYV